MFGTTQCELLHTHLIAIKVTGALLQDGAGNQGNMVKEVEEGCGGIVRCWWREKQKHSFKKMRKNNVYKAILISTPYITKWNTNPGDYPRICMFWGTHFVPFYGQSKICTGTGHRLVCGIFGACLMAISEGTFPRYCKMAGKFWVGPKEERVIPLPSALSFI